MNYSSPLNIYIVWHPEFKIGRDYFQLLYSVFCRDVRQPLSRGISIPVFERSTPSKNSNVPLPVDIQESDHTAIVLLVDDEMFNDLAWFAYVEALLPTSKNVRLYPVAFSKYSHKLHPRISEIQFINLQGINEKASDEQVPGAHQLVTRLLHELSRQLLQIQNSTEIANYTTSPVKLFVSHAKLDGETIAKGFRDYVRSETKLASFFDANDIPDGSLFAGEIERNINGNAVIVVFQTDAYSSREWCRREIIMAKRYKLPILVVNAVEDVERRSFPYLGNVPVMRWKKNFGFIVKEALFQVLYQLFTEMLLQKYIALYLSNRNDVEYITSSPELFNYVDIIRLQKTKKFKKIMLIYPDPPLGIEELQLLNDIDDEVIFVTPVSLPTKIKLL